MKFSMKKYKKISGNFPNFQGPVLKFSLKSSAML